MPCRQLVKNPKATILKWFYWKTANEQEWGKLWHLNQGRAVREVISHLALTPPHLGHETKLDGKGSGAAGTLCCSSNVAGALLWCPLATATVAAEASDPVAPPEVMVFAATVAADGKRSPGRFNALTLTSGFSSSHLFVVSIWVLCNCWAKTLSNSSCFSSSCCFFFWRSIFLSTFFSFFWLCLLESSFYSLFLWGTMRNQTIPLSSACWFFVVPHEIAAHFW